ncbi:MAG: fused MFS/spermidine synthase [Myxococcota bacterium]
MSLAAISLCFWLSGIGSLVLEVVWTRELRLVFGSTTLAVSTILVAYMLGLGLGGLVGARIAHRLREGLRVYGWLELGIAGYAAAVPFVVGLYPELNREVVGGLPFWTAAGIRFAMALGLFLLPTLAMGATLPILVATTVRRDSAVGASVALLYGLNTLGAVAGVFLATFVLFPGVGLRGTNWAGAGIDALVGALALLVLAPKARGIAQGAAQPATRRGGASEPAQRLLLSAYAAVGFTSLVYEVAWTRALAMVLGSSIYAFSAMLAAFLGGIALGSLVARRFVDRLRSPRAVFEVGILVLGLLALCTSLVLQSIPDLFVLAVGRLGTSPTAVAGIQLASSVIAMLPPTALLGALFPLLTRALSSRSSEASQAVGRVYFANTLGSAAGAFAAGFVLIPSFGVRNTLLGAALLNLATSMALLLSRIGPARPVPRALAASVPALVGIGLWLHPPAWSEQAFARGAFREPLLAEFDAIDLSDFEGVPSDELVLYRDGLNATISVHRARDGVALRVNGKPDASSFADMPTQVLSAHIPLLFGPPARDVLVIGLASGVTVGSVARHPVERIDAIELEPAVVEASHAFDFVNGRPLEDPRVHLVVDDARSFLSYTNRRYDAIISEPSNPWMSGVSNLFTREYFALARHALRPGGRLLQWVQLYGMAPPELDSLLAAVQAEFPYVYACASRYGLGDLLLLATLEPLGSRDLPRWSRLPRSVREDLSRVGSYSTEDLWSLLLLLPESTRELAEGERPNTDDNMRIELRAPWAIYDTGTIAANWRRFDRYPLAMLPLLAQSGTPVTPEQIAAIGLSYRVARQNRTTFALAMRAAERRSHSASGAVGHAYVLLDAPDGRARARELLDETLEEFPQSFSALLLRATLRAGDGDAAGALADAAAALKLRPDDPRAAARRAIALGDLGKSDEAVREITRLLARGYAERLPTLWLEAARIYCRAQRLDECGRQLSRFLMHDPESPAEWRFLAQVRERQQRPEDAARALTNAERAERDRPKVQHLRALLARDSGNLAEARSRLRRALQLDPDYTPARRALDALPES